jgi:hypothetical protein
MTGRSRENVSQDCIVSILRICCRITGLTPKLAKKYRNFEQSITAECDGLRRRSAMNMLENMGKTRCFCMALGLAPKPKVVGSNPAGRIEVVCGDSLVEND